MKAVVTGGGGFVGSCLVRRLLAEEAEVTVLTRRASQHFPSAVRTIVGDLTADSCPTRELLAGCEVLFHCAGETRDRSAMARLHVHGTQRLLAAARDVRRESGRIIHWVQLSSIGAYGSPLLTTATERVVTESLLGDPAGEYEVTKTRSDELVACASSAGEITSTILRPSKVIGVDMPDNSLKVLADLVRRGLFFYIGKPGAVATYIHVNDLVEALLLCGRMPQARGNIYNLSNDCFLEDLIQGIARAVGRRHPRLRLPERTVRIVVAIASRMRSIPLTQERVNGLVRRTRYSDAKIRHDLGYNPKYSIPDTVREVIDSRENAIE